jgi:hypothetical protein
MGAQDPPDYGTAPRAELQYPRSPAFLVFAPWGSGAGNIVAFGADQYDQARAYAAGLRGVVVAAPVYADYS